MAAGVMSIEPEDLAAIWLTDLMIDVFAEMGTDGLSELAELADPLTAHLAAWVESVRED